MSEAKFTKGEWIVDYDNDSSCEWYYTGPAKVEYSYNVSAIEHLEAKANAHLIASAPEMYEMLSKIHDYLEVSGPTGFNLSLDINDLLKKARGEK